MQNSQRLLPPLDYHGGEQGSSIPRWRRRPRAREARRVGEKREEIEESMRGCLPWTERDGRRPAAGGYSGRRWVQASAVLRCSSGRGKQRRGRGKTSRSRRWRRLALGGGDRNESTSAALQPAAAHGAAHGAALRLQRAVQGEERRRARRASGVAF
jgi:hypothetical protein